VRAALDDFLSRFEEIAFEPGDALISNTYRQPVVVDRVPRLAYVHEGVVVGAWHESALAPTHTAAAVLAGDAQWVGFDAFKYGENLFRYTALAPTRACIVPLASLLQEAGREALIDALRCASLAWCTAASLLSLGSQPMERRILLLLHDVSRAHRRRTLQVSQRVLGELLGMSRQALNPVLKGLEKKGLFHLGYGQVVIEDPSRLIDEIRRRAASER
jgi:CRP-like cAMP-binding protein